MSDRQIPQLDISEFETDRIEFVERFGEAYTQWGFAGITGHGIAPDTIHNALSAVEQFFSLPTEIKQKYLGSSDGFNRGYVPFGTEKAKDSQFVDLKEFFHIGREHLQQNVWPIELAEFQSSVQILYSELDKLARKVLQVAALYLQLKLDYFEAYLPDGETLLRAIHYPPISDPNMPNVRAAAHEDINLITLLVGSEQDGLEVLSRQNEWVPISLIQGTIICNVGDMLQRLSNARLPSTTHRVVNPAGEVAKASRYSIPFFVHPDASMSLSCLPQCVDDKHPLQFSPMTAGEFLEQRLLEIGLKK